MHTPTSETSTVNAQPAHATDVVILCGGRGTRLQEHTQSIPKPLVEIGGKPIVWHVIQIYAVQGFADFVLCTGYRGELIEQFAAATAWPDGVTVRLRRHRPRHADRRARSTACATSSGRATACVTYADGVADVDLQATLAVPPRPRRCRAR